MSIFKKDNFTLKELCSIFKNNDNIEIFNIINCYYYFSSNNINYRKYLNNARYEKGFLFVSCLNKNIYLREILQNLDMDFTKLIIRIKTNSNNYDINITWKLFEEKNSITKEEFEKYLLNNNYI
jgi:hypothetical protein